MGVSFLAVSCEHPVLQYAMLSDELNAFIQSCKQGGVSEAELMTQKREGFFTGLYAIHPLNEDKIPVWVANYVLPGYGEGAVMGVPAHDARDFDFARSYELPLKWVIQPDDGSILTERSCEPYLDKGVVYNSGCLDGMNFDQAYHAVDAALKQKNLGGAKVQYRLRDWGVSRQRYWGCPIPMINCDACGVVPVPEQDLPVVLPTDVVPDGRGNPLNRRPDFYEITCPQCRGKARRETDTMDTFMESSWYYARFTCPNHQNAMLSRDANHWLPVHQYVGGVEHAVMHLLYARFFHKILRDEGLVYSNEPFEKLLTQGMVLAQTFYRNNSEGHRTWFSPKDVVAKDGAYIHKSDGQMVLCGGMEKMSKSKNNGISPIDIIESYGADTARLFVLFAAPPEQNLEWSDDGIEGASRFLKRLWRLIRSYKDQSHQISVINSDSKEYKDLRYKLHRTIEKVTDDFSRRQQFNTAIAAMMELLNAHDKTPFHAELSKELLSAILVMLMPITPHVCEYLWIELMGSVEPTWPSVDLQALQQDQIDLMIQINGKLRARMSIQFDATQKDIEQQVLLNEHVSRYLAGSMPKKIIVVPGRLVNIVV
jgi:leucyl-tRNA synthetase